MNRPQPPTVTGAMITAAPREPALFLAETIDDLNL